VTRRARAGIALVALAAIAASCAPPPRPGTGLAAVSARYGAARAARAELLRALWLDLVLRVDLRATGRLPALPATLALAAPDHLRLQVGALLGVGLDVLLDADSVRAWAPGQRLAFAAPAESLGVRSPAAFAGRALAATWEVPAEAWREAAADSAGWRVGWREGRDSLSLRLDAAARPREAWVGRGDAGLRVRYSGWSRVGRGELPSRWEIDDDAGRAHVRVQRSSAESPARPETDWFAPRRSNVEPMGWPELRELIERGGRP
jgi:hypothetical protein